MDIRIEKQIEATKWLLEQRERSPEEVYSLLYRLGLSVMAFSEPMKKARQPNRNRTAYNSSWQRNKRAKEKE